jgi:hypothetical protein
VAGFVVVVAGDAGAVVVGAAGGGWTMPMRVS